MAVVGVDVGTQSLKASPLGAAMLAAVEGGLQPDLPACAALVRGGAAAIHPDPAHHAAYQQAYRTYRALFESPRPLFGAPPAERSA